jgi:predicted Fe-Mo cluster-binding NifX family protein
MKVAVASNTGEDISSHFGRCACFAVFEVEEGKITGREVRPNTFTPHATGRRPGEGHSGDGPGHHPVVQGLGDCEAVISYGMGWRAAQALQESGVRSFVLDQEATAEEAVDLFLRGELKENADGFCRGHEA